MTLLFLFAIVGYWGGSFFRLLYGDTPGKNLIGTLRDGRRGFSGIDKKVLCPFLHNTFFLFISYEPRIGDFVGMQMLACGTRASRT
jgi:hypothetical protein